MSSTKEMDLEKERKAKDLVQLIKSLDESGTELSFQVMRLTEHVKPRTETEQEYHDTLKKGYENASYYVRLLKRYHEGRLEKLTGQAIGGATDSTDAIDSFGAATPYIDDKEAPA